MKLSVDSYNIAHCDFQIHLLCVSTLKQMPISVDLFCLIILLYTYTIDTSTYEYTEHLKTYNFSAHSHTINYVGFLPLKLVYNDVYVYLRHWLQVYTLWEVYRGLF